jgi:hypothetical protein
MAQPNKLKLFRWLNYRDKNQVVLEGGDIINRIHTSMHACLSQESVAYGVQLCYLNTKYIIGRRWLMQI